jgi:prepilin-type N-terminal cleavage/methylation domain-containing protein
MRAQRSARNKGFTLVEVMLAVSVLVIGAMGFTALQGATSISIQSAYETNVALDFMETWVARLQRDALAWRGSGTATWGDTQYLRTDNLDTWFVPTPTALPDAESWAADAFGRDTRTNNAMRYCVNVRLTNAHRFNPSGAPASESDIDMLRADVRVWWYRSGNSREVTNRTVAQMNASGCKTVPSAEELSGGFIRQVVTSTMLRWR